MSEPILADAILDHIIHNVHRPRSRDQAGRNAAPAPSQTEPVIPKSFTNGDQEYTKVYWLLYVPAAISRKRLLPLIRQ